MNDLILQAATFLNFQSLSKDTSCYCYLKTSVYVLWKLVYLFDSGNGSVKCYLIVWAWMLNGSFACFLLVNWMMTSGTCTLCISLGFCFGIAVIFWKLWTTKHVSVILLWTMMLAAVMLLLWSFAKNSWIFTRCCCCDPLQKNTWIFTGYCCCSLSENLQG